MAASPKVAIIQEWLDSWGGAEQVLLALHQLWPEAPIFTTVYVPEHVPQLGKASVRPSFLNSWPLAHSSRRPWLFPLMPLAVEQYDLRDFDVVISSSYGPAKGVITHPGQFHLCYCHTPTRFLWEPQVDQRLPRGWLFDKMATGLRQWDQLAAARPDQMLANSKTVQGRISKYYRRDSQVVYPPVDVSRFQPAQADAVKSYFLSATRLVKQKHIDLIISAFKQTGQTLKISGRGPEEATLKARAAGAKNIEFLGFVPDAQLAKLMAHTQAFVFAAEEDFGIVPIEAMAAGRPVIAYSHGGATETVLPGKTGLLFPEQTAESLATVLGQFSGADFDPKIIRKHAEQFDTKHFQHAIKGIVEQHVS